jgi:GT2 family glycosyltransferase
VSPSKSVPDADEAPAACEVAVVFVTYNSAGVIGRAVASVPAGCAVVIVDNASPEGTAWRSGLVRPAEFVAMGRNAGFGTACNAGARVARARYVLFLNPDAVLEPDSLARLLDAARRYGAPGVFMPTIVGEDGKAMRKEGSVFEPVPRRARLGPNEVAGDYCTRFVHGAAFMMERAAFLELGGFDEAIFLYHEDDDLSLRLVERRIPITVVADALVVHAGGGASTPSLAHTFRVNRAKKRSELYLYAKYRRSRSRVQDAAVLLGGCLLAALLLDPHRFMIRAGKLAGVLGAKGAGPS